MPKPEDAKNKKNKNFPFSKKDEKTVKADVEEPIHELILDEVNINLEIKEIRYGKRVVIHPEITTMINNSKITHSVPFESPIKYTFRKTEDEMVFKFAVTSAGDLLGFIYLEIPHKFKSIKKFKLDDWFPVKLAQTADQEKMKVENFVARIIVNYESTRKLEQSGLNNAPKTLRTQLAEEASKNLRQKIDNIHEEVDAFQGDGFKHLGDFQKKLMDKKIKSTTALIEIGKKENFSRSPTKLVNTQKEAFYKERKNLGETVELKNDTLKIKNLFNRKINASTENLIGRKTDSCLNCENLLKELAYTRKELIEAHQRISQLEEKQMSVDNVKLRKQLEKLQDDLNKDKKELALKLRDHSLILDQEREKLVKIANDESSKSVNLKNEANTLITEYKLRFKDLQEREQLLETREEDFDSRLGKLTQNENDYIEHMKSFLKERDDFYRDKEEWQEIKKRMISERQRIHEESSRFQYIKSDLGLKKEQLQVLDDFFGDEKNKFRKEMDSKVAQIEDLKYELIKKQEIFDLEQRHLYEQQQILEEKNEKLVKDMKKIKEETDKLNTLRMKVNKHTDELQEIKEQVNQDHQTIFDEIEQDYIFIDQQLKIIDEQKQEIIQLKTVLENYEKSIEGQSKLNQELQIRFNVLSKQFLQKINNPNIDIIEFRKIADVFVNDFKDAETKFNDNQRQTRENEKQRISIKKNIDVMAEKSKKVINLDDRRSIHERRATKKNQDFSASGSKADTKLFKSPDFADISHNEHSIDYHQIEVKERQIDELREIIKSQQKMIVDLQNAVKSAKSLSSQNDSNARKSKDQNSSQNMLDLNDLQLQMEVALVQATQNFKNINSNQIKSPKYAERAKILESGQRIVRNIFKMMNQSNDLQKENINFEADFFDHEKLASKYEKKIADLIEFIQRVKTNTDFFNNNMDNEILIR